MASYEILRALDRGGMAEVFLARLVGVEGFEKRVVLKRVLPHLSRDRRFVERFLDEARLAATLSHPNIVQIFELGQQHGQLFIAMEHIDGKNVRELARRLDARGQRMPVEHAVRVACSVCEALHYAHGRHDDNGAPLGIVHRDVSPSNVLVSFDGAVKLIDFGIAKTYAQVDRTRPGAVLGKRGYMSPEQCRGERLDGRSDLFSCGAILYRLLLGRLPFPGDDDLSVMKAIARGHVVDPRELEPSIDEELRAILLKALARRREDRYTGALEMQLALEGHLAALGLVSNTALLGEYLRSLFDDERRPQRQGAEERTESRIVTLLPTDPSDARAQVGELDARVDEEADAFGEQRTLLMPRPDGAPDDSGAVRAKGRRRSLAVALAAVGATALAGAALALLPDEGPPAVDASDVGKNPGRQQPDADVADSVREAFPPLSTATHAERPVDTAAVEPPAPVEGTAHRASQVDDERAERPRARSRGRRTRRVTRSTPEPADDREGRLTLDTQPWSEVFLDDERIGMTPIAEHALPSGRHTLVLVNKRAGLRRQVVVEVRPGKTTRLRLPLAAGEADSSP